MWSRRMPEKAKWQNLNLGRYLFNAFTPLGGDTLGTTQASKAVQGCLNHIMGVMRTDAFSQDVAYSRRFQNGTHRTAGDYPGTLYRRLEQNLTRTELTHYLMGNADITYRNKLHVLTRPFNTLADSLRHLVRLSKAIANPSLTISYDHNGAEVEPASTLDHFGCSVDKDNLFDQLIVGIATFKIRQGTPPSINKLKIQTAFPGTIGEGLNSTVIDKPAAIKNHALYPFILCQPG